MRIKKFTDFICEGIDNLTPHMREALSKFKMTPDDFVKYFINKMDGYHFKDEAQLRFLIKFFTGKDIQPQFPSDGEHFDYDVKFMYPIETDVFIVICARTEGEGYIITNTTLEETSN